MNRIFQGNGFVHACGHKRLEREFNCRVCFPRKNKELTTSPLEQLKTISKTLDSLILHEYEVSGEDMTDAIDFDKIKDLVDTKIEEIEK